MNQTAKLEYTGRPDAGQSEFSRLEGDEIGDLIRMFWRRRGLIVGAAVLITGLAALIAFQITPRYTATARLMIMPTNAAKVAEDLGLSLQSILRSQRSSIYGEIEVMTSDRMIERLVEDQALDKDPEFNRDLRPGVFPFGSIARLFDSSAEETGATERARTISKVIDALRGHFRVRPPGLSNVVNVEFETRDPEKSARLANAFTELYIADQLDRKFRAQVQARRWLDDRLSALRETMIKSERAAADYQAVHRLTDDGRTAIADQQYLELTRQLIRAKAEHAEKSIRLEQVVKLIGSPDGGQSIKEIRRSLLIQRLREQEGVLVRRSAEYENRFGERHPNMINLRAELKNLRARILDEQGRIVQELRNEVRVAQARIDALEAELKRLDGTRTDLNREKIHLRQLQREASANRTLYELFLARFKQTKQEETLRHSDVEVISPAKAPFGASYPRRGLIVGFGFLVSIAAGAFLVVLVERLDTGFGTLAQVERVLNSVPLEMIPRLSSASLRGGVGDLVVRDSGAPYVEALRSLRTSLMISDIQRPPKIILIASALPGEGKTSLAISLARLSAISAIQGPVILIDCDLRQPAVANELGMAPSKGLIHLFAGETTLDRVIVTDPETGLHVLPATPGIPNPPELLNSRLMKALLEKLSHRYETIIVDSPALSAVSDARVLAHLADATVFVVEWESTPRNTALESFRQLVSAGATVAGVVLQKVNVRKSSEYGYDDAYA